MSSSPAEAVPAAGEPGAQFLAEIREQPHALLGLLEHEREFARVAAATKPYLNQVAALALLAAHAGGQGARIAEGLRAAAGQLAEAIDDLERRVLPVAIAFAFTGRMFVIGRGVEFGTAREIALKL